MTTRILKFPDINAIAASAAEIIIAEARSAVSLRGRFSMALSGGSTPRALYSLLASPAFKTQIEWTKTDLFWGDERCVSPDHPDSDYLMAKLSLLDRLSSSSFPGIHRLEGEMKPQAAAERYEVDLRQYFGLDPSHTFDVLLLGMGDDGHTASLFPGTAPIHETEHWVVGHYVPKLASWRLTLTPPILNLARITIFLVAGQTKSAALKQILEGSRNPDLYPSQAIQPVDGILYWLVDDAAGEQIGNI